MKKNKSHKNRMKQIVLTSFMSLGMVFGSAAMNTTVAAAVAPKSGNKTKTSNTRSVSEDRTTSSSSRAAMAKNRADHLSDQMITKLKLNNYQSRKIREINLDKINKLMDIEQQFANDPEALAKQCKGVCDQRDAELEDLLSTDQYSQYFGARNFFNKYDTTYAQNMGKKSDTEAIAANVGGSSKSDATTNQTLTNE